MPNWFNRKLTLPSVKHSVFDLSNDFKTSFKIGQLMPLYLEECLPSDKFLNLRTDCLIRFAPLYTALLHRVQVHTNTFFTPFRIILGDECYENWMNNKVDLPKLNLQYSSTTEIENPFKSSIVDYLGYDPALAYKIHDTENWQIELYNPLPFFTYLAIVRDWYLDSNIQRQYMDALDYCFRGYQAAMLTQSASYTWNLQSFPPIFDNECTFQCSVNKDYFSTARPQPELGTEMFVLNRPLTAQPISPTSALYGTPDGTIKTAGGTPISDSTTIKDLWKKEMLQHYYQIDNKFGSRIREKIAGHFGVEISDKRIMIPRFVSGNTSSVNISEVIQTSSTVATVSAQGNLAGKASNFTRGKKVKFFCEEHGYMLTLVSLIPDNGYCQGMPRTLFKQNMFDFASPEFNNIGWQEIYNGEIFCNPSGLGLKAEWGYQPRYSEYRSHPSRCAGVFRDSNYLKWHLNRSFASLPPLNSDFLKVPDCSRVFNFTRTEDSSAPYCFIDAYTESIMSRPISAEPDSIHIY